MLQILKLLAELNALNRCLQNSCTMLCWDVSSFRTYDLLFVRLACFLSSSGFSFPGISLYPGVHTSITSIFPQVRKEPPVICKPVWGWCCVIGKKQSGFSISEHSYEFCHGFLFWLRYLKKFQDLGLEDRYMTLRPRTAVKSHLFHGHFLPVILTL